MIPQITQLIIRIEQLEWDLREVKEALVKLQGPILKDLTPEERLAARSARNRAQKERMRPAIEKVLGKPKPDSELPTAEELQRRSLEDGINPEDNVFSSLITEERERER